MLSSVGLEKRATDELVGQGERQRVSATFARLPVTKGIWIERERERVGERKLRSTFVGLPVGS